MHTRPEPYKHRRGKQGLEKKTFTLSLRLHAVNRRSFFAIVCEKRSRKKITHMPNGWRGEKDEMTAQTQTNVQTVRGTHNHTTGGFFQEGEMREEMPVRIRG